MTTKLINQQEISVRPQSDAENIVLENMRALLISGKKLIVEFKEKDMLIKIVSGGTDNEIN